MALVPQRSPLEPEILISPVWGDALKQTLTSVESLGGDAYVRYPTSPALVRESAGAVLARSHGLLLSALDGKGSGRTTVDLLNGAARLLGAIAHLWLTHAERAFDERLPILAGMLERQLSAHEHGVLSAEQTYAVTVEQAERAAVRMRQSLSDLGASERPGTVALISMQIAAIELAGLMIRAGGNIASAGRADDAPEQGSQAVGEALTRVVHDISAHAKLLDGQLADQQDRFGTYIARALRVGAPAAAPGSEDPENLGGFYEAWLQLAALTRLGVQAVDAKLSAPTYAGHEQSLDELTSARAAELLAGGRLTSRADRFRHDQAWSAQSARLSYAVELYISGVLGASEALEQAQAIIMGTLVYATVAGTLVDLRRNRKARTPTPLPAA